MNNAALLWPPPPAPLHLPADEIHVWRAALDLAPPQIATLRAALTPDEIERADRFRQPLHRDRFTAARGILRALLSRYLAAPPATLRFRYGQFGKPELADDAVAAGLRFNLTHAEGLVLIAVARHREVGVDLESLARERAVEPLAERFFSPDEAAALRALPAEARRAGFFNAWTRKEAYIKATGHGLTMPLDQFTVSLAPGEPACLRAVAADPAEVSRWTLHALTPGEGFVAALAVAGSGGRVRCWQWLP